VRVIPWWRCDSAGGSVRIDAFPAAAIPGLKKKTHRGPETSGVGPSPRLYQRAYALLAEEIRTGGLPTGSELSETSVAGRFGVSRAPARRALSELAQAGLIERSNGRGYVVKRGVKGPRPPHEGGEAAIGQKLVSEPSWQRIYREVEEDIAARISFASWRLNEAKLADHYHVSRTVTRDVIGRLQQRGLVTKDEASRWVASALTPQHVSELYELRWLLEPAALIKAASHIPPDLLERMRKKLVSVLADPGAIVGATLDELERDLHVTLLGFCDNATLMQAIVQPQSLLIAHRFLYRWTARLFDTEPFLAEHMLVFEHLERGQANAAASALETHLRDSRDRAIARIDVIAGGAQPDASPFLERLR
jgi:DNA-binding GntR family transcriptional regulator